MVTHARTHGAGNSYLIEHSAGSGKSNTIAWLAHRLSTLFDDANKPVFDKIVVITDRVVLNQQLQKTIYQFDHTPGVVKKIDEDSSQLAGALGDTTSKIVISTLQMYPFVLGKIAELGLSSGRYAVIIDEAHTSQGGDAALRLKQTLGANSVREPEEDEATYLTRVRGKQPNLSYFAFTATPTSPTLKLFGTKSATRTDPRHWGGDVRAFHVYSMRQAIDEGYILDVLANYLTYDTKWRLRNLAVDQQESATANPEVDERKAKSKLVRFAELHPTSLDQKAKLIVDDFRATIAGKLGGRAKAMVVTSSRQHALSLYQAIRKHVQDTADPFGVLVAFSGSLKDEASGLDFTEAQLNGIPEAGLPKRSPSPGPTTRTASRTSTGCWWWPRSTRPGSTSHSCVGCTWTRRSRGVAAVQTLSRLNRTHALKSVDDVRILDFVNTADDIAEAFKPWFETTLTPPSDPNLLYDRQRAVMDTRCSSPPRWSRSSTCSARPRTGGRATPRRRSCTSGCMRSWNPPSTGSRRSNPARRRRSSAVISTRSSVRTASSGRSSTGRTPTWRRSTSTAGSC